MEARDTLKSHLIMHEFAPLHGEVDATSIIQAVWNVSSSGNVPSFLADSDHIRRVSENEGQCLRASAILGFTIRKE